MATDQRQALFALRTSVTRVHHSMSAAVQVTAATLAAYGFAHFVLGHDVPLLAATTTISTLGFARDARPRRVIESALGILIGIIVSESLLIVIGASFWRIIPFMLVALLVGRFISESSAFAAAAATQSILVLFLPPPDEGFFVRSIDGAIGGVFALVATALVPRDVNSSVRNDAQKLFTLVDSALLATIKALEDNDQTQAEIALDRARSTQPLLDAWQVSLASAIAVAAVSPWLRRYLQLLRIQESIHLQMDLAIRNLRVIIRRIDNAELLFVDGTLTAKIIGEMRVPINLIRKGTVDGPHSARHLGEAQHALQLIAAEISDPAAVGDTGTPVDAVVISLLQPLAIDLLMATGLAKPDAVSLFESASR